MQRGAAFSSEVSPPRQLGLALSSPKKRQEVLRARAVAVGQDTFLSPVGYANPDSLVAGGINVSKFTQAPLSFKWEKELDIRASLKRTKEIGVVCDTHNILYSLAFNKEGERTDRCLAPINNPPSFDLCSKRRFSVMARALKSERLRTVYWTQCTGHQKAGPHLKSRSIIDLCLNLSLKAL